MGVGVELTVWSGIRVLNLSIQGQVSEPLGLGDSRSRVKLGEILPWSHFMISDWNLSNSSSSSNNNSQPAEEPTPNELRLLQSSTVRDSLPSENIFPQDYSKIEQRPGRARYSILPGLI